MKMSSQDVQVLREAITVLDTPDVRARYIARDFPRADTVKDLDRRYRFDLFYAVRGYALVSGEYLDSHFETALRSIVPPLV